MSQHKTGRKDYKCRRQHHKHFMGDWEMRDRKQEHAHAKQQLVHPNHYPKVQLLPKTAKIMKLIEPLVKLPALGTGHDEMKPHRVLQMVREDQQNAFELRGGGAGGGGWGGVAIWD